MKKVAIAGLGTIGCKVAEELASGNIPGFELAAIAVRNEAKAIEFLETLPQNTCSIEPLDRLPVLADVVIEALPPEKFEDVARPTLENGKTLLAMSASQLLGRDDLVELAKKNNATIVIPSGAMLGLDALKAVAVGTIHSVTIQTRKPPKGLVGAPYLVKNNINVEGLKEPLCILKGCVDDIASHFPANVNVAAAVSLAGIGSSKTQMEIWADPTLTRNTHKVTVVSDSSDFTVEITNRPSESNPRTGRITAQSVIAWLKSQTAPVRVGT